MKTAVSIPDDVFREADTAAQRLGWTRSQLYAHAVREFLNAEGDDPVTAALDALADEFQGAAATVPARSLIDSGAWEW